MELSGYMPPLPTTLRDFIPLVMALFWPVTILILVCWFRSEIKGLINSVTEAKFFNSVSFTIDRTRSSIADSSTSEILSSADAKQISAPSTVKWGNVADLFWLGNDLEWTVQTLLQDAPQERIVHGLTQLNHHTSGLGLADSIPGKLLSALKSQVEGLPQAALDRRRRNAFAEEMYSVIKGFDILVRQHQPNFRPGPES